MSNGLRSIPPIRSVRGYCFEDPKTGLEVNYKIVHLVHDSVLAAIVIHGLF